MGKKVLVKLLYKGKGDDLVLRDMTEGRIYEGYIPCDGERDSSGFPVASADELWIPEDDAGGEVVSFIGENFEIVGFKNED